MNIENPEREGIYDRLRQELPVRDHYSVLATICAEPGKKISIELRRRQDRNTVRSGKHLRLAWSKRESTTACRIRGGHDDARHIPGLDEHRKGIAGDIRRAEVREVSGCVIVHIALQ